MAFHSSDLTHKPCAKFGHSLCCLNSYFLGRVVADGGPWQSLQGLKANVEWVWEMVP